MTKGSVGMMMADLHPIGLHNFSSLGMCTVNVHWHLGAEHFNVGTFDMPADVAMAAMGKRPALKFRCLSRNVRLGPGTRPAPLRIGWRPTVWDTGSRP